MNVRAINLDSLFDELNEVYWNGRLPKVPCRWSTRMRAIAGKFWGSRKGPEIVLSVPYHEHYPDQVCDTMKHEMVHVYVHQHGMRKRGSMHGPEFRAEAQRVGAPIHCQSYDGMHRSYKYEWACPNCGRKSKSRVKRTWGCRPCCNRFNRGRYSRRFKLQLSRILD